MSYEFEDRETEDLDYECNHASSDFDINYASGGPISYRSQKSETKHNIAKPNTYQVWEDSNKVEEENFTIKDREDGRSQETKVDAISIFWLVLALIIFFGLVIAVIYIVGNFGILISEYSIS